MDKHRSTKDCRQAFLHLDSHQKGQGSDETCATNAWDKLSALVLMHTFPVGVEAFFGKWGGAIVDLDEVGQAPSEFTDRTLFKQSINDLDYSGVLTNLDTVSLTPPVELCEAEIRKADAKLENSRKVAAFWSDKMMLSADGSCDDDFFDSCLLGGDSDKLTCVIAALAAKKNSGGWLSVNSLLCFSLMLHGVPYLRSNGHCGARSSRQP